MRLHSFVAPLVGVFTGILASPMLAAQCTVHDLNPGAAGTWPQFLVPAFGQHLYLNANIGGVGSELYRWSQASGLQLVADINPGSNNSNPQSLAACCTPGGPRVLFSAFRQGEGQELWRTDGTPVGTVLVRNIRTGSGSSFPDSMVSNLDRVFFAADDGTHGKELWVSDGTFGGTVLVADINPSGSSQPDIHASLGDLVVFTAWTAATGRELWVSDGTPAGTVMLGDIRPGTGSVSISEIAVLGDRAYFSANDGTFGTELWSTDGSPAGTQMVVDLAQNSGSSSPLYLTRNGDELFFVATGNTTGQELYKTDGTAAGTVLVKDIRPGALSSQPRDLIASNGRVFFSADDNAGNGRELWVSDGTAAGTVEIDLNPAGNSFPQDFAAVGTGVCFAATDAMGSEPWFSDGTPANTFRVCDIDPGPGSATPQQLTVVRGRLFFQASDPALGNEVHEVGTPGAVVERRGVGGLPSQPALKSRDDRPPVLGTTLDLDSTGPANAIGALTVGFGKLPAPGAPGLTLGACDWTGVGNNTAAVVVVGVGPTFSWAFSVPNVPGYTGLDLAFQTVWFVPGQNPVVEPSNGLQLVLGGPVPM